VSISYCIPYLHLFVCRSYAIQSCPSGEAERQTFFGEASAKRANSLI